MLSRRGFLSSAAILAAACAPEDDVPAGVGFPIAPWHMWGATQRAHVVPVAGGLAAQTLQLLRINYGRPDTWSFFFAASVLGSGVSADVMTVRVDVDLMFGVGRSVWRTEAPILAGNPQFVTFFWNLPAATNLAAVAKKWTTIGSAVQLDDTDATTVSRPEWIAAQDIQAQARIQVVAETTEPELDIEVTGWLAPRSHIRPDWFSGSQFRGRETGGT